MEYNYFVLLPITIGIGGLMTFILSGRWRELYDKIQIALIVCSVVTVYITIRALVKGTGDYTYLLLDNIESLLGLLICPLFHLYMRTITRDRTWRNWYWWLFAPGIIIFVVGTILSIAVGWDRILAERLSDYSPFVPATDSIVENWYLFVNIDLFNITLEVMAVILIGISVYYLITYNKRARDYYANLEESCLNNMRYYLMSAVVCFLVIFLITLFFRYVVGFSDGVSLGIALLLSVIFFIMLFNAYKIKLTEQYINVPTDGLEDSFTEEETDVLGRKIAVWQDKVDKPYCKEGLTISDVAKDINVNRRILSEYINKSKCMNFNSWINTLRIEEAKRQLVASPDVKLSYVSAVCGYADQAAFSKAFRKFVGCTPQSYRDSNAR